MPPSAPGAKLPSMRRPLLLSFLALCLALPASAQKPGEARLGIEIANRGAVFRLTGSSAATKRGEAVIRALFDATADAAIGEHDVHLALSEAGADAHLQIGNGHHGTTVRLRRRP